MNVGFIGLGHLGKTIAGHLINEGIDLTVWNRTREKAEGMGVPVAASPRELAERSDIVILNLFDSTAVEEVLAGTKGILSGNCAGKIIIDTTTNHFDQVTGFHDLCRAHEVSYLECPVLGSVVPASQGTLTVLISGDRAVYGNVRPLLEKLGKTHFFLGEPALATKMKLVNNLVLGSYMATCAEAVSLGEAAGISRSDCIDILLAGAGNSMVLNAKKDKLKNEEFSTHFSSALIYKDLHYLQDLCRTMKKPLVTGSMVKEVFALTRSKGIDHLDFSAVYRIFQDL
jgi:3-hydroxyisobutyrate dehydrogenase